LRLWLWLRLWLRLLLLLLLLLLLRLDGLRLRWRRGWAHLRGWGVRCRCVWGAVEYIPIHE
jgi:hypothetical protein